MTNRSVISRRAAAAALAVLTLSLASCTSAEPVARADRTNVATGSRSGSPAAARHHGRHRVAAVHRRVRIRTTTPTAPSTLASSPPPSSQASTAAPSTPAPTASAPADTTARVSPGSRPVIVVDPGHSVAVSATDPVTHMNVSDYENEPEMRDVFAVALIVRHRLRAAGYRVVLTKNRLGEPTSLLKRARIANRVHAALALSIHDQAGSNGGIGFDAGNNTVYYQRVGDYRVNERGQRVVFRHHRVARVSRHYGRIFRRVRAATEHHHVAVQGSTGYNLGSRGLPAGNIWIVQLLSHVPWIYNEAGGNSAGRVGLSWRDKHRYAAGLVASVERCVPVWHRR